MILPQALRALICEAVAQQVPTIEASHRVGLRLHAKRVSDAPLRMGLLGRLMRKRPASAKLSALTSKYGGRPYVESADDWPAGCSFVGQLNFAELAPGETELPPRGILTLFASNDGFDVWPCPDSVDT